MKISFLHPSGRVVPERLMRQLAVLGHECIAFGSAKAFLEDASGVGDLLVIDGPGEMAVAIVAAARNAAAGRLPVLLLAEVQDVQGIGAALAAGVDDYAVKPVRERELLVRIRVLLERAWPGKRAQALLEFGRVAFDTMAGAALLDGRPVVMTQKEFALALLFFRHLGQPLSRTTLRETLWPETPETDSRTIDTHVSRVRKKLELLGAGGFRLAPVFGYGYVLEPASDSKH